MHFFPLEVLGTYHNEPSYEEVLHMKVLYQGNLARVVVLITVIL